MVDSRVRRRGLAAFAAAYVASLVLLAACGGGSSQQAASASTSVGKTVRVIFTVPTDVTPAAVDRATKVLEQRFAQLTQPPDDAVITSYSVRRARNGIAVETPEVLDHDLLAVLAAPTNVTWRPVTPGTPTPPCTAPGQPSDPTQPVVLPSPEQLGVTLCYQLGPAIDARNTIRTARARQVLKGWVIDITTNPAAGRTIGRAASTAPGNQIALIGDDRVLAAPSFTANASTLRIAGEMRRGQAKGLSAALAGGPLPFALGVPNGPGPERPIAGVDHWVAPIGVNICGRWLPNAPPTDGDIHSHGDGYVHIHPFHESAAGSHATLGAFFASGKWTVTSTRLKVWDHRVHQNGDRCNGKRAAVHWTVNGAAHSGNPSTYRPQNNDVIVIAFVPDGVDVGAPPVASSVRPTT